MLSALIYRLKFLFILIVNLVRRAFCCFSRRRKTSNSELQFVEIDVNSKGSTTNVKETERDWNSWDDSPRTVEEHIEQYRQKLHKPQITELEPEPDFFQDMTPQIKPQQKFYLGSTSEQKTDFSRLEAAKIDVPLATGSELEDWAEDDFDSASGWDGDLDPEAAKQIIREKRREQRNQRKEIANKQNHLMYKTDRLNVQNYS